MTVYISADAKNLREELASLRNQGGYEEQQFYFDGLVTNGTFDADTDWTKGTGWTISGGVASHAGTTYSNLQQSVTTVVGVRYSVKYVGVVGSFAVFANGVNCNISNIGGSIFAGSFVAQSTTTLMQVASASDGNSLDNISIFETDGTDVVHRMPKGWVPLHVYEDGLLQREGAANDYEVVYDGFDYYVKPAVAPSATTQTCVIGVRK